MSLLLPPYPHAHFLGDGKVTLHEDKGQFSGTLRRMKGSWFTRVSTGTSMDQQVVEARGTDPVRELLPDA